MIPVDAIVDYCTVETVPANSEAATDSDVVDELLSAFPELVNDDTDLNGADAVDRINEIITMAKESRLFHA